MSFGHWRLTDGGTQHPLPPHLLRGTTSNLDGASSFSGKTSQFATQSSTTFTPGDNISKTSKPYGSGENDNYNLVFPSMAAFEEWRAQEEESQVVEFVKGDTHGSKAVPPRFKEHTKLVCARHQRSGRKRYVKKYPDRVRKVPSRKLEGTGCPASISYKTYHDKPEVRACYYSQHSHEIGPANLAFTKRGRKAMAENKDKGNRPIRFASDPAASVSTTVQPPAPAPAPAPNPPTYPTNPQLTPPQHTVAYGAFSFGAQPTAFAPPPLPPPPPQSGAAHVAHERWENMQSLFSHIRENARSFEYPSASVAALETVLIRLYLESPVSVPNNVNPLNGIVPGMPQHQHQQHPHHPHHTHFQPQDPVTGEQSDDNEMEEEA